MCKVLLIRMNKYLWNRSILKNSIALQVKLALNFLLELVTRMFCYFFVALLWYFDIEKLIKEKEKKQEKI